MHQGLAVHRSYWLFLHNLVYVLEGCNDALDRTWIVDKIRKRMSTVVASPCTAEQTMAYDFGGIKPPCFVCY
jgi:hypothetical protein